MGEIDEAFIQTEENRPKVCMIEEGIPVIDLSPLVCGSSSEPCFEEVVRQIGSACREWGFFQVINHGSSVESRQKMEEEARKFFQQSKEQKNEVRRDAVHVIGYFDSELTRNVRDWKEVFDYTVEEPTLVPASPDPHDLTITHWYNRWPQYPPHLREALEEYGKEMEELALKLMELIALSLGLAPKRFHGFFKDQTSWIRLNFYPPCPSPHLVLGCGRHKDSGALTVLAQDDVCGLEVKRKSDGQWVRVIPAPNAYIINVGAVIEVWSNETYESVEHRVILNSEKERLSYPFFLTPAHYTMVQPLEELLNNQNPPKYRPYNWGKFFLTRKRSNFVNLNVENIQIYDFKIN
ncbi:jasmonate-induced oxygenase 2-like [Vigna umbellata]|uniref:jasmonate-induced oxygenase 2-like n=1 Tax=Vigna umbellata TaxID=87088 RepID=UPI001F5F6986|nr:jasmonate-induced oxygenase 2-like [Vigna umbellata]